MSDKGGIVRAGRQAMVMLRGVDLASEFFEPKDNVLQGVEVCDLSQRRRLELRQQRRKGARVEPFGDVV